MLNPLAWDPVTVKFGSLVGGTSGQTLTTLPSIEPPAEPLSLMMPFDQTSPVTLVVEVPVNTSEGPVPLQLP